MLNKDRTARNFSKAAATYDQKARWQANVAAHCLQYIPQKFTNALDLGCGTGTMAIHLQKKNPEAEIHGIDLAEGMIYEAQKRSIKEKVPQIIFQLGDIEHIPYPNESFDLVVSNLSLQWLENPQNCFTEVQRVLKPEGRFIFTTLLDGSLIELQKTYQKIKHPYTHPLLSAARIKDALNTTGLIIFGIETFTNTLYYKTFPELIDSVRGIGAKTHQAKPLTKTKLKQLIEQYPRHKQGYPITYEVLLCTALKIEMGYN